MKNNCKLEKKDQIILSRKISLLLWSLSRMANILEPNCFTSLDDAECNFVMSKVCQIADEYLLNFFSRICSIKSRVII